MGFAEEGMWMPMLLKQWNQTDMQNKGFKLTADDIYSVNKTSMKDAVLLFGAGCTGELVSAQGLLITNHHCGYSNIQALSTMENNMLDKGFWAYSMDKELPCPGLSVTFIIRIEDVTSKIVPFLNDTLSEANRDKMISQLTKPLIEEAVKGTHYEGSVRPFYYGNEFYLL
ncbi:MAG: S46 family peptidase [Bacteroidetes bacterium]|nr:S46 family peptidase [Bacteroidota bacterium]